MKSPPNQLEVRLSHQQNPRYHGAYAPLTDHERQTLRDHGNMSAPTVMFVMKSVLDAGAKGQMMACALGPGFTASYLPFQVRGQVD
jgi:predicted naringenin-chalcone synthase